MTASPFWLLLVLVIFETTVACHHTKEPPVVVAGAGPAGLFFAQRYLDLHPSQSVRILECKQIVQSPPPPAAAVARTTANKQGREDDKHVIRGTSSSSSPSYDSAFGFGIGQRARYVLGQTQRGGELLQAVEQVAAKTRPGLWMVNRQDLCHVLQDHLLRTYGKDRVEIIYGAEVCGIDCGPVEEEEEEHNKDGGQKRRLFVEVQMNKNNNNNPDSSCESTTMQKIPYSLLVAADGTNSRIRKDLVYHKRKLQQRRFQRPVRWKALQLPPQPQLEAGSFLPLPMPPARDEFGAVIPRHPNRFVALLFWRPSNRLKRRWKNPFGCTTPQQLKESLQANFPTLTTFPPQEEMRVFLQQPPGCEYYMKLNHHVVEELNVALIGDAANGVYSRLAQGCAYALWSANLLAEELGKRQVVESKEQDNHTSSLSPSLLLSQSLQSFSKKSVREGHSLSDLNLLAHIEYTPWLDSLNLFNFASISKVINQADLSYTEILSRFKWRVVLAKLHWRFSRIRVQEE